MRLPWFYGWTVVGAALIALTVAYSLHFSYGLFVPYFTAELNLDRASAAAPFSLYIAAYSIMSFVTGPLTDRIGPKLVVSTGGVLLAVGYGLLSRVSALWELFLVLALFGGLGMSAAFIPLSSTVVKWFVRRRGLAVAIMGSGTSAAFLTGPLIAAAIIPWLGWREGMLAFGMVSGVIIIICAMVLVRDPESIGLLPDGDLAAQQTSPGVPLVQEVSWTLAQARRTLVFWLILAAYFATWIPIFFPAAHLPSMLVDEGQTAATAAQMIGAMGIGALLGRWVIGWAADTFGNHISLGFCFAIQVFGYGLFAIVTGVDAQFVASVVLGLGVGSSVTMFPVALGTTFGRAHVGAISGFIFSISGTAAAIGPYCAGLIREYSGSYTPAFAASALLNLLALVLILFVRPPIQR